MYVTDLNIANIMICSQHKMHRSGNYDTHYRGSELTRGMIYNIGQYILLLC